MPEGDLLSVPVSGATHVPVSFCLFLSLSVSLSLSLSLQQDVLLPSSVERVWGLGRTCQIEGLGLMVC